MDSEDEKTKEGVEDSLTRFNEMSESEFMVHVGDIKTGKTPCDEKIYSKVLDSVGGQMSDIVKVTVFVTDMSMLDEIHRVRAEYFTPPYPASSLVQVTRLVRAEYLIEIEAVAVIPFDRVKDPN